jgi:hypothetical protein
MKGVAMDKHRGEAPRGYTLNNLDDIANSPLDKVNIYNVVMQSPELMYTVSQKKFNIRQDAVKLQRLRLDVNAIKAFANDYVNKKYKPSSTQYSAANIGPQLIYNYLAVSKRWKEAETIGKTLLPPTPTSSTP